MALHYFDSHRRIIKTVIMYLVCSSMVTVPDLLISVSMLLSQQFNYKVLTAEKNFLKKVYEKIIMLSYIL